MIETFFGGIFYIFLFMTLYLEVFFLVTFLERQEEFTQRERGGKLPYYPSATIIVPVWNEEKTVSATVHSLLRLHYPKNKLNIIIVDDGSTDRTWEIVQRFVNNPRVTLLRKTNGGKHTAVNLAIKQASTELIGCLDADSFAEKDALTEIARAFNDDPHTMAVTPMLVVHEPKTILQKMQRTEYYAGAFLRRMLSPLDGIFVTPGPFSFFRKEVFDKIGLYKKAHNTEDMEFALRMQSHHMRIRNVHTAHVHTTTPGTLYALYRQRLRWTYGIMKNTLDYRFMLFRREYGLLGMVVLPLSFVGVFIFLYNFSFIAFYTGKSIIGKIIEISVVGMYSSLPHFNLFFLNTDFTSLLSYILLGVGLFIIFYGTKLAEGRFRLTPSVFYFIILYGIVAPLWLTRATIDVVFARGTKWR